MSTPHPDRIAAHRRDLARIAATRAADLHVPASVLAEAIRQWRQRRAAAVRGLRRDGNWNWLAGAGPSTIHPLDATDAVCAHSRLTIARRHRRAEARTWRALDAYLDGRMSRPDYLRVRRIAALIHETPGHYGRLAEQRAYQRLLRTTATGRQYGTGLAAALQRMTGA